MHIKELVIEGIRGWDTRDRAIAVDFVRDSGDLAGWNVFVGRNGSGKTSLLRGIALAVAGPIEGRALVNDFTGWVNSDTSSGTIAARLIPSPDSKIDSYNAPGGPPTSIWAGLHLERDEHGPPVLSEDKGPKRQTGRGSLRRGPWSENPRGWFLTGYGPFRRLQGGGANSASLMNSPNFRARLVSLFQEEAALAEGPTWLRELHLRRLEDDDAAERLLDQVLSLLSDGLLPGTSRAVRYDKDGLWIQRGNATLPLRDMSDGYRTVVALVLDLVRQMYLAHGEFHLEVREGIPIADYEGVVLIDEVDAHLHIEWQQEIGFWFIRHFPRIQFFVTTHSPYVCQAASLDGLFRLPGPAEQIGIEPIDGELFARVVNGTANDAALTHLFGLRKPYSHRSARLRERASELQLKMFEGEIDQDERREYMELRSQLPNTDAEDTLEAVFRQGARE